jgi:hypothetical protein
MTDDLAGQVRVICLALPEVTERLSHGAPTWFVGGKKSFVTLWANGHHNDEFPHLWCAGLPGAQQELTAAGTVTRTGRRSLSCARTPTGRSRPPGWLLSSTGSGPRRQRAAATQRAGFGRR